MPKLLIIEDDAAYCQMLQRFLKKSGYEAEACYNYEKAREKLETSSYDLVLSDLRLPGKDGLEILEELNQNHPQTRVVIMTGYAQVSSAVSAMKLGALDYISKPFTPEQMLEVLSKALSGKASKPVKDEPALETPAEPSRNDSFEGIIRGVSKASSKLQEYIQLAGPTDMSILITGESGTGKEVTARALHACSKRKDKPFVAVDCGAIARELAASEFFGHLKGSFTGAIDDKVGHFEAANGGTLFLDEVGNLSYEHQVQLLRTLQEHTIKRIGSTREIEVDVRIIAATNEDLRKAVEKGEFREDLYHRLNEFTIQVPSLRERSEDLPIFAEFFLEQANKSLDKSILGFSEAVMDAFTMYSWPGNLREMRNVVKRAVLLSKKEEVELSGLPPEVADPAPTRVERPEDISKEEFEKDRIISALKRTNFNKSKAAKLLNVTRKTLYNKLNQYNLDL